MRDRRNNAYTAPSEHRRQHTKGRKDFKQKAAETGLAEEGRIAE
jgi:hypothetical protein